VKKKVKMEMSDFDNMLLALPNVDIANNIHQFKQMKSENAILDLVQENDHDPFITRFEKKCPLWSEKRSSYVLNFGKRIKQASIKNTQLLKLNKRGIAIEDQIYFQFGKIDSKSFVLDLKWPFSVGKVFL